MPPRITEQRMQNNIESLRAMVNARSPSVVRNPVVGSAISGTRRKHSLPCIGQRSGHLVVTGYIRGTRGGVKALIVKCDCDRPEYTVAVTNFRVFRSTRCNICAKQAASKKHYWCYAEAMPNDAHRTRLLNRLAAAITRCHTPTSRHYKSYGARGIQVCTAWRKDRATFLKYVQTLEGWDQPELEMDRINNNKGYAPKNIRFVSRSTNAKNKRQIADLEATIARLRRTLRRTKEQILRANKQRPATCS